MFGEPGGPGGVGASPVCVAEKQAFLLEVLSWSLPTEAEKAPSFKFSLQAVWTAVWVNFVLNSV